MQRIRMQRTPNRPVHHHASRSTRTRTARLLDVSPSNAVLEARQRFGNIAPATLEVVTRILERHPTRYERYVKPVVDRVVGALLVLMMLPVIALIALAVLVTLGSPIFIRQDRIGRGGRPFGMLKFRTMKPDRRTGSDPSYAGPERRKTHKTPNDPRHTPLGRKLRQNSLDELPQLINIVRGDMSLVGPRPELHIVTAGYQDWQHLRHMVRPGLTGLWQITERANGTVMHEHTELDLSYVDRLSASTDFSILWKTPRALLKKEQVH
jgi:lipopolysaccharide/colanic/teichoic acid biosynthesis glycosyltransferase